MKIHIIVVDDESELKPIYEIGLKKLVRTGQATVTFFNSALDALSFLDGVVINTTESTLLLSDINMPEMNGLQLLEEVKGRYEGIDVIMISAYDTDNYISKAYELGAIDYLSKPFNITQIQDRIVKHHPWLVA
jgi:YesN/AraC family two-component response regulator